MLDADAVINNSSQNVGGSHAYPDSAPKKWVGPDPEKHIGSTPGLIYCAKRAYHYHSCFSAHPPAAAAAAVGRRDRQTELDEHSPAL